MTIRFDEHGNVQWNIYRKAYKKSRWRKCGQRLLEHCMKQGYKSGLIIVI